MSHSQYDDLKEIIDAYHHLITSQSDISRTELTNFQRDFFKNAKVQELLTAEENWVIPKEMKPCLESVHRLKKAITKAVADADIREHEQASSALANLLGNVLEGEARSILSHVGHESEENFEAMMSENEFWIGPWDPEYVGASEIFLSLNQEQQSILSQFSSESLKTQFMIAFPWAAKLDSISKLETARPRPNSNILNYDYTIPEITQMNLVNCMLLSFDMMGKLAGKDGELVIQNYNAIDAIITNIEQLQSDLENPKYVQSDTFADRIEKMVSVMQLQNQQLYTKSETQSSTVVAQNELINNFCHLNECLAHALLGIPIQESILTPKEPSMPHRECIKACLNKNPIMQQIDTVQPGKTKATTAQAIGSAPTRSN